MRPIKTIPIIIFIALALVSASCRSREADSHRAFSEQRHADSLLNAGDYQNAMRAYVEAFRLSEASGTDRVKGRALAKIGTIYAFHDDFQKAVVYYERALQTSLAAGDSTVTGMVLANLVMMEKTLGDKEKEEHYKRLYFRHPMSDAYERDYYALYIPFLDHLEAGRDNEMQSYFQRLMRLLTDSGRRESSGALLYNHLGLRYMERGMPDSALRCYRAALGELGPEGNANQRQSVYTNMCQLFQSTGQTDSFIYYQARRLEASDSVFNLRNFNAAKDMLDSYEATMTRRHISRLETIAWYAVAVVALIGIVMVVVIVYSRKINRARLALVRRSETLMRENESLTRKIATMEKEREKPSVECISQPVNVKAYREEQSDVYEAPESDAAVGPEEATRRPLMGEELRARLSAQVIEIMNDKVTVFNPDYNQGMLAVQLGTNSRYVSEVIRGLGATNFRNFINEYRIREACRRLADREHYGHLTISAIAQEVGFNSDSRFLVAFKKVMEMTPAQYRKLSRLAQE